MTIKTTPTVYDPAIESDGLTLDTPLGPVDLVAVQRVLDGHPIDALTEAEMTYLANTLGYAPRLRNGYGPEHDTRRRAAESLHISAPALSTRIIYRLRRDQTTTARKVA
ncbi:hypothetical protein [Actinospica robiniae]|uniref:hypothetical protein n=1 Tax=Actinospica robiniae TaxID=304901 RepID=UPI0004034587|nr:hypothetical protein [Actinospica robiniae]